MPSDIKDTIKDKVNKLAAATRLVTNFLDDLDQTFAGILGAIRAYLGEVARGIQLLEE